MSDTAAPLSVQPQERIQALDILRGFALLGIFIMNMPGFNTSFFAGADGSHLWPAWWDRTSETVRDILFSGKFNSLFSLLFGIGFTIQLGRLMDRAEGKAAIWVYCRRLLVLLLFGILHACVFWTGDVLHIYAMLGLVLLVLRRAPDAVIVAIIAACLLYPTGMGIYRITHQLTKAEIQQRVQEAKALEASNNAAYGHGTFLQAARQHTHEMTWMYQHAAYIRGFYLQMLATLLLGFLIGRHKLVQNAREHLPLIRKAQWWCFGLGLLCGLTFGIGANYLQPMRVTPLSIVVSTAYAYCRPLLMLFYAATLVRLSLHETWQRRLRPIALVGRMPLTNYLGQTLMGTFLFYGWGLGLWGKVGPAADLALAILLYAAIQVPLSVWWFRHFQFGPMEYLWRTLTYGSPPVLQLPETAQAASA